MCNRCHLGHHPIHLLLLHLRRKRNKAQAINLHLPQLDGFQMDNICSPDLRLHRYCFGQDIDKAIEATLQGAG